MTNAFDRAFDAYRQRKIVERQHRLQQLRAELTSPQPSATLASGRSWTTMPTSNAKR